MSPFIAVVLAVVLNAASAAFCIFLWLMLAAAGDTAVSRAVLVALAAAHLIALVLAFGLIRRERLRAAFKVAAFPVAGLLAAMMLFGWISSMF